MKYLLWVLLLVVVYIGFSYVRVVYQYRHAKNPHIEQADSHFGAGATIRYIAAGDSASVGEGSSEVSKSFPQRIAKKLGEKNYIEYRNVAVVGAKSSDVLEKQVQQIVEYNPDIVTISMGGNDATHLVSEAQLLANYTAVMQQLTEQTHAKIYITNIPNFNGGKLLPRLYTALIEYRSKSINPKLLALETDRVKMVDIHNFGWDQFPDRSVTYSSDGFHPSDVGYQNWADAFLARINP